MRLEIFFEKFDLFADAPDAVAKMRELVLRMATSGRIADQDPSDPPASELLEEIFAERDRRIRIGAARSRVEGSPITAGDTIDIPASWVRCTIAEVCDLQTGATPSRQEQSYFGGDIPWLVSGDVNKGEITECDGRITEAGLAKSNCKIIPPNSVLIALNGQGKTRATVAVLRISAALNQSLVAMIPFSAERLLPEYIFWNLRGRYYAIRGITGHDQRRGLNMKLVGRLSLPIPPLAEQKRIVAKVDELMALCDRLEMQQQERETRHAALARVSLARFSDAPTPANLDLLFNKSFDIPTADLRKSILTLAVQGKLIPFDTDGEEQYVGDHIEFQNGYAFKSEWFKSCGVRLCRNANVSHGVLDWRESAFVDDKVAKEFERFALSEGDIVLSLDRPLISTGLKVARVTKADLPCLLLQRVAKPVPKHDQVDLSYFLLWLNSSEFVDSIDPGRSNGVPHISTRQVQRLPFILPPLAEQRLIIAKVAQLTALVDELETQQATARATGAALVEAVVAELT